MLLLNWQERQFLCQTGQMHVVIYLPTTFYAGIASTIVEALQAANDLSAKQVFTFEFVSRARQPKSNTGITFPAQRRPTRRMDVLILLAGMRPQMADTLRLLEQESKNVKPLIHDAEKQGAIIATTCGAAYLLAAAGILNGKRATISWWLKNEASRRFPRVRWTPQRLIVRQGLIYTTGAAYAGLELVTRLLIDLGFAGIERKVRKMMVLPPSREFQSPYEFPINNDSDPFQKKLDKLAKENIRTLTLGSVSRHLGLSTRTLSRTFHERLQTSPGKWIQSKRLEIARTLLETTRMSVAEICYGVGYQDVASFSRLFSKNTGMSPREFRKYLQA